MKIGVFYFTAYEIIVKSGLVVVDKALVCSCKLKSVGLNENVGKAPSF